MPIVLDEKPLFVAEPWLRKHGYVPFTHFGMCYSNSDTTGVCYGEYVEKAGSRALRHFMGYGDFHRLLGILAFTGQRVWDLLVIGNSNMKPAIALAEEMEKDLDVTIAVALRERESRIIEVY